MENQVTHHLIKENRSLKAALKQLETQKLADQDQKVTELQNEISVLQRAQLNMPVDEEFDPDTEFDEVRKLFDLYKMDCSKSDLEHLYMTCFYTQDKALVQQFKVRVFQNIAQRALRNQEALIKTQSRRKGVQLDKEAIQVFADNKRLHKQNKELTQRIEELNKRYQDAQALWNTQRAGYQSKLVCQHDKLLRAHESVQDLRNELMMLNTYSRELHQKISSKQAFADVMAAVG